MKKKVKQLKQHFSNISVKRTGLNISKHWFDIGKEYLDLNWSIIPIGTNKKALCKWKDFQTKLASIEQLEKWCKITNLSGFAVVTGKLSNVVVLDIDNGSEFDASNLPKTPNAITGSGGYHYYFAYPKHNELRNFGDFQPKTDIRGEGGYAILPPSTHKSGNNYSWTITPHTTQLSKIPQKLLQQLQKNTKPKTNTKNIFSGVKQGSRNDSATKIIGKLLRQFPKKDWDTEVWIFVKAWNLTNNPPLAKSELEQTFKSIKNKALKENDNKNTSPSQQIVDLILQKNIEMFLNQLNEPCIILPSNNFIAQKISSEKTKYFLSKLFWESEHKIASSSSLTGAITALQGLAQFENPQIKEVFNRIGRHNGNIYYDLGNEEQVVEISKDGWKITSQSPILFERYSHQKEQVIPQKNGKLTTFLDFANVSKENEKLLLLTNLVVSFIPDIPRYILALNGDPGSAKSTLLKEMRELIDPSIVPLSAPPRNSNDLIQIASHNYAVYLDNLSTLSVQTSDALCRFVTGEGFSKRQLYTDDSDILYSFKRLIGICGVNQVAIKPDLLSRCLVISLDFIEDINRKEEAILRKEFAEEKPKLLGAIFDCLSYCLKVAPALEIKAKPRMADHFRYATAVALFLGYKESDLQKAFSKNSQSQNDEAIEASPVAPVILEFMKDKKSWNGTSTELYGKLLDIAIKLKVDKKFPKAPNWLWRKIKEVRANLIAYGIKAENYRDEDANKIRLINSNKNINTTGNMETMEAVF